LQQVPLFGITVTVVLWQPWDSPAPVGLGGSGCSCDASQGCATETVAVMDTFEEA